MLQNFTAHKVIRCKAVEKAIWGRRSRARGLRCAGRAEKRVVDRFMSLREHVWKLPRSPPMTELGDAVGIDVGAAAVVVLH